MIGRATASDRENIDRMTTCANTDNKALKFRTVRRCNVIKLHEGCEEDRT